jgi:hypothetical protein
LGELKRRAIDLGLVFEPPNATLRVILGLAPQTSPQPQVPVSPTAGEGTELKAATLIISVPYRKGIPGAPGSFETYMQTGVGKGYALSQREVSALHAGCKVVLLRNDRKRCRGEGVLVKLDKTDQKTPQGIPRYDVFFRNQRVVNYSYTKPIEQLNRRGVKVIDCGSGT